MHQYCFLLGVYNVDSYLKPHLTIKQMVNGVKLVLALLDSYNQSVSTFGDQNLTIDIDEKWFYVVPNIFRLPFGLTAPLYIRATET